jgi:hypothetical protein
MLIKYVKKCGPYLRGKLSNRTKRSGGKVQSRKIMFVFVTVGFLKSVLNLWLLIIVLCQVMPSLSSKVLNFSPLLS